jgi:acyl-[acyl-carrier-protein] desaturase
VTKTWTESDLLLELEPVVEGDLNGHTGIAREWFPHEYVRSSDCRNYGLLNCDAAPN